MKRVTVTIKRGGDQVIVATDGFTGKACEVATARLKEKLGIVTAEQPTPEMYQTEVEVERAQH